MRVTARRSHAACHSFATVRPVAIAAALRSTALRFTRTSRTQSSSSGVPGFRPGSAGSGARAASCRATCSFRAAAIDLVLVRVSPAAARQGADRSLSERGDKDTGRVAASPRSAARGRAARGDPESTGIEAGLPEAGAARISNGAGHSETAERGTPWLHRRRGSIARQGERRPGCLGRLPSDRRADRPGPRGREHRPNARRH